MCNDNDDVYRVKYSSLSYNLLQIIYSLPLSTSLTLRLILATSSAYALGATTRNTHHHALTPAAHAPVATTPNAPVAWKTCVGAATRHAPVVTMLQG